MPNMGALTAEGVRYKTNELLGNTWGKVWGKQMKFAFKFIDI